MMRAALAIAVVMGLMACPSPGGSDGGGGGSAGGGSAGGSSGGGSNGGGSVGGGAHGGGSNGGGSNGGGSVGGGTGGGSQPGGTSCADAILITQAIVTGKIDVAGKRVFYQFPGTQGAYMSISTETDNGATLDTTITLFDETGATKLASVDDAYPRVSTDSLLYYRVPADAMYCLVVEDFSTWHGDAPEAHPNDEYTLILGALKGYPADGGVPPAGANPDKEPNNTAQTAQAGTVQTPSATLGNSRVYGMLDSQGDVDMYKFTAPIDGGMVWVTLPPNGVPSGQGVSGYGSGLSAYTVRVMTTGGSVLGEWQSTTANIATSPPDFQVPAYGDIVVSVERPTGHTATSNDFYVTDLYFIPDSALEAAGSNDTQGTAQALVLETDTANAKHKFALFRGNISPISDVDQFSFTAGAGDFIGLSCGAARSGSGLVGATFNISNAGGSLQSETETLTADVTWANAPTASKQAITATGGTYYVKVNASSQSATNTGNYYRCGVHVTTP